MVLVKPEYASVCYLGLREAVIYQYEIRKVLKRKEEESNESQKISKALIAWINGEEFEETVRHVDDARKAVDGARGQLVLMRNYVNTQIDKVTKFQNSVEQNLIHVKGSIAKLKDLLNNVTHDSF